jgi:prepilin-type N-terminal cleavage/methylation domain-containing protein
MRPLRPSGFTFVEILVVLIVLGILATLAFNRLQANKEKAVVAAMEHDLRAIAFEQEAYYFQNRRYADQLTLLPNNPSPGNTITIVEGTSSGWSGQVTNPKTSKVCAIVVGSAAPIGSAQPDKGISCS